MSQTALPVAPTRCAKAPCVRPLAGVPRGETHRATEYRPRAELRLQPSGPRRRLQRADVHAEFCGQSRRWPRVRAASPLRRAFFASPRDDVRRRTSQATVPHPERVDRDVKQVGQLSLRQIGSAAQLTQLVHVQQRHSRLHDASDLRNTRPVISDSLEGPRRSAKNMPRKIAERNAPIAYSRSCGANLRD